MRLAAALVIGVALYYAHVYAVLVFGPDLDAPPHWILKGTSCPLSAGSSNTTHDPAATKPPPRQ